MKQTWICILPTLLPAKRLGLATGLLILSLRATAQQIDSVTSFNLYQAGSGDFKVAAAKDSLTSVSSLIPLSAQESPGSITIFTKEEIRAMGARDLVEVLNMVPGFSFGGDIEGQINPGVRGNIAQEAVSLVVDGIEMNELLYGSLPMMNRFSMDQVEKIEVIRGPGSSVYGGFATFAVINVTTQASVDKRGFNMSNLYGRVRQGESRQSTSMSLGVGGYGWRISATGNMSRSITSNGNYRDYTGNCFSMFKNNSVVDRFISTTIEYKGLTIRYLGNSYHTKNRDSYNLISAGDHNVDFDNNDLQVRYRLRFGKYTEIIPQMSYTNQAPWYTSAPTLASDSDKVYAFDKITQRLAGGIVVNTNPSDNLKFSIGSTHRFDYALNRNPSDPFADGKNTMKFNILSVFAQMYWRTKVANLVLGGRVEKHSAFNPVFAPRIALSRRFNRLTTKVGYTRSYKMPTFENFNLALNSRIQPQYTSSLEGEVRYAVNNSVEVFGNLFEIKTQRGIAYFLNSDYSEGYSNCGTYATRGAEGGLKGRFSRFDFSAAYSFYTNKSLDQFRLYRVPGHNLNLAFPAHKATLIANMAISKSVKLNGTVLFQSARYAYQLDSSGTVGTYVEHKPSCVVNIFATTRIPIGYGLEAGLGVKNLFNERIEYIQPYASFHNSLPGLGREYVLRVTYEISSR